MSPLFRSSLRLLSVLASAVLLHAATLSAQSLSGGELQVATPPAYDSIERATVSMAASGDFVVAWEVYSSTTYYTTHELRGRRFGADGAALGAEFEVESTSYPTYLEGSSIRTTDAGAFTVVWSRWTSICCWGRDTSILRQPYGADGSPSGGLFQVATGSWYSDDYTYPQTTTGDVVGIPAQSHSESGRFSVVWGFTEFDPVNEQQIRGQLSDAGGSPIGNEFVASSLAGTAIGAPRTAISDSGEAIVVWQSEGSAGTDSSGWSIQGRRISATGAPLGDQFQVNSGTVGQQTGPAVEIRNDGSFVVAWASDTSTGSDSSGPSIQARLFSSNGSALAPDFQVNTYTTSEQSSPALAMTDRGDALVVWSSQGSDGTDSSGTSVRSRLFDRDGDAVGEELQVNTTTAGDQYQPSVATNGLDTFVVSFVDRRETVRAQRIRLAIFADGFESADTNVWSSSAP